MNNNAANSKKFRLAASSSMSGLMEEEDLESLSVSMRVGDDNENKRVGVLLLNLGGPETLEDVQEFLYNLFADPDILRLPDQVAWAQPALASVVSYFRAPQSQEGYKAIGGGSPIRRTTEEQATSLESAMREIRSS